MFFYIIKPKVGLEHQKSTLSSPSTTHKALYYAVGTDSLSDSFQKLIFCPTLTPPPPGGKGGLMSVPTGVKYPTSSTKMKFAKSFLTSLSYVNILFTVVNKN